MHRIRFTHASSLRVEFSAGDELSVTKLTPEVRQLLNARRIDGQAVCELVDGPADEAHTPEDQHEHAAIRTGRGRRTGSNG